MKYKIWVSVNALYVGDLNEWVDRKFSLQLLDYISNYTVRKWIPICKYSGRGGIFSEKTIIYAVLHTLDKCRT